MDTGTNALNGLLDQMHEANRLLSDAAQPLDHLEDLSLEQREQLAKQLRAAVERWDTLTQQIRDILAQKQPPPSTPPAPGPSAR